VRHARRRGKRRAQAVGVSQPKSVLAVSGPFKRVPRLWGSARSSK
jgi:hypothetical protein